MDEARLSGHTLRQTTGVLHWCTGLLLSAAVAGLALHLAALPALRERGIGLLCLAMLLGLVLAQLPGLRGLAETGGVTFARQRLLRLGIVLYGFRLTFGDVAAIGITGVVVDFLMLGSTFLLACFLGVRVCRLERGTAMLIGAGNAVCGAAAVLATAPVVRARDDQVAIAIAVVVLFGTLSMLLYPVAYGWATAHGWLQWSQVDYGMYAGSTIHEVAQVVAAGRAVSEPAADVAVVTKMVRVMLLAPFLMLLALALARRGALSDEGRSDLPTPSAQWVPWFALGFLLVTQVNTLVTLPHGVRGGLVSFGDFLLAMAMAALGLATRVSMLRAAGFAPIGLAALLFTWLIAGGMMINVGTTWLMTR